MMDTKLENAQLRFTLLLTSVISRVDWQAWLSKSGFQWRFHYLPENTLMGSSVLAV